MTTRNNSIEAMRGRFFLTGLSLACAAALMAFEWRVPVQGTDIPEDPIILNDPVDQIPVTYPTSDPAPPPPAFSKPSASTFAGPIAITIKPQNGPTDLDNIDIDDIGWDDEPPVVEYIPKPPTRNPEVWPQFPGGEEARLAFLRQHVSYPEFARINGIEDKVYIEFTVGENGALSDLALLNAPHHTLVEEALRVVQLMPPWNPGSQGGKKVAVRCQMVIAFSLR